MQRKDYFQDAFAIKNLFRCDNQNYDHNQDDDGATRMRQMLLPPLLLLSSVYVFEAIDSVNANGKWSPPPPPLVISLT